ncbi:hypothetical protein GOODEAATRI_024110, partial [Goodea atripinnis]
TTRSDWRTGMRPRRMSSDTRSRRSLSVSWSRRWRFNKMAASGGFTKNKFLFALPQKEGYEFFVGQWSRHELHFSSLINIQVNRFCLANQVQLFYGTQRQETYRLVETFNHHPEDFKHMSVIAELEQSGLGSAGAPGGS